MGISYALLRLEEVQPHAALREAALEGLAFVRSLYSSEKRSWRDIRALFQAQFQDPLRRTWKDWWATDDSDPVSLLENRPPEKEEERPTDGESFPTIWCHGSAGIALAKLDMLHLIGDAEVREEIRYALDAVKSFAEEASFGRVEQDDLCCGHMGRVEVRHQASRELKNGKRVKRAQSLALQVVNRGKQRGHYAPSAARGTATFSPTFYQGMAGIGYTLLRLARPESLPCLLLFQ